MHFRSQKVAGVEGQSPELNGQIGAKVEAKRHKRHPARRLFFGTLLAGVAVMAVGGKVASSGEGFFDNLHDGMDLLDFTSPDGQTDRARAQRANDGLIQMQEYFAGDEDGVDGPLTMDQARAIGPAAGLEPESAYHMLTQRFVAPGYDGDVETASSAWLTEGALIAATGLGIFIGGVAGSAYMRAGYRKREEETQAAVDAAVANAMAANGGPAEIPYDLLATNVPEQGWSHRA